MYVDYASHSMLKTRAAVCEYREHINLHGNCIEYRDRAPTGFGFARDIHFDFYIFPHVYSLLPFSSFPVLLSPLGPTHYSVKTKSSLSLFPVLLSPLGPSHYST